MSEKSAKKPSKFVNFFKSIKGEFSKIVWPDFKTVVKNTSVVISFVIIIAVIVYILDLIFGGIFTWAVNLLK